MQNSWEVDKIITEVKIRKGTFQHIESELSAYHETKREIERIREDILYGVYGGDENVGGGRSNLPGDPTGKKGTRLASDKRLRHLETVVEAIESVMEQLPEKKRELVRLKYWTKSQAYTWDGIALKLDISRRQAIRWRDEVIYAIAAKIGWR